MASIAYTCHPAGLALFQTLRRDRESLRQGRASQFGSWRAERGATGASGTLSPGRGSLSHRWPNLAGTIDGIAHLVIVHAAVVNQGVVACLQTSKDSVGSKASDGKRKKPQAGTNTCARARRHPSQRCTHARSHARTHSHARTGTHVYAHAQQASHDGNCRRRCERRATDDAVRSICAAQGLVRRLGRQAQGEYLRVPESTQPGVPGSMRSTLACDPSARYSEYPHEPRPYGGRGSAGLRRMARRVVVMSFAPSA